MMKEGGSSCRLLSSYETAEALLKLNLRRIL